MEYETINEVTQLLDKFGDSNSSVLKTKFSGIVIAETMLEALEVVARFREKIENEPWELRYSSRIIPIQKICQTDLISIKQNVIDLIPSIKSYETYKISLEKRDSEIMRNEIISNIANLLTNKVSLEEPDWEIILQILGEQTGISVMPKNSILSISKIKRLD
jgi:tRNA acetyltransferase TAN1